MLPLPGLNNIKIPLILSPMEGITDPVFRRICTKHGADAGISEFISSEALIRNVDKSLKKMNAASTDEMRWVQIFGNNPASVADAARVAEDNGAHVVDLNFGCPVKKIVSKGNGAALLRDLPLMQAIAEATVKAVKIPVTAKTRLGWDSNTIVVHEAALRLQDAGIQILSLHGRTRAQQYGGIADWNTIAEVKALPDFNIPLVANGDINSPEAALKAMSITHADGLMIGRAAIGNPWIFAQIKAALNNMPIPETTLAERFDTCTEHFTETLELKGEKRAVTEMRKQFALYFKGIAGFKPFKMGLLTAGSATEVYELLEKAKAHYL